MISWTFRLLTRRAVTWIRLTRDEGTSNGVGCTYRQPGY